MKKYKKGLPTSFGYYWMKFGKEQPTFVALVRYCSLGYYTFGSKLELSEETMVIYHHGPLTIEEPPNESEN